MSDAEFERRVERALKASVPTSARAKHTIMESVRRAAREGVPTRTLILPGGRATRHSLIGIALAAGIGSITTMTSVRSSVHAPRAVGIATSVVIGDSVVDRFRDTLRLVRLIFDAPAAREVAVVGDFNGWRSDATRMRRDGGSGPWIVTLALHDGDHRYAIVVDNTRWARDMATPSSTAASHAYSLLHVARATN